MKAPPITRWGLLWREKNKLDGVREHLICLSAMPLLFHTRKEARHYARLHYGYIARRKDLRQEPHGWRMPKPVRVVIQVKP